MAKNKQKNKEKQCHYFVEDDIIARASIKNKPKLEKISDLILRILRN